MSFNIYNLPVTKTVADPYLPLTEVQRQADYLIDFERMRRAWVSTKDQQLEQLCDVLATADDEPLTLTVKNYCSAKERLLATTVEPTDWNAEFYSQRVVLNFYQNQTDAMNSNQEMGLRLRRSKATASSKPFFNRTWNILSR